LCGSTKQRKNIITFDGGSTVYNSKGEPVIFSKAAYAQELLVVSEADLQQPGKRREEKPEIAQKYEAIIRE